VKTLLKQLRLELGLGLERDDPADMRKQAFMLEGSFLVSLQKFKPL